MAMKDFDGQYSGLGIMQGGGGQDSGLVVKAATPATVSITYPTVGGVQPTIQRGKWAALFSALNAAAVLGTLEISATDGTNTEYLDVRGPSNTATAAQGATFMGEFFSALVNITNIVTVTARMNTTGNNNYSMELRVCGGM
ncbi:MAG: hypothetical protein ACYDCQ_17905 [Dehalococcoidia bacterium]